MGRFYSSMTASAEYSTGSNLATERGLLWKHESGTYVKFTQTGAEMFA
jgi:hypothetical protein